jgi:malate dehydrogenase (oxaloacetate-decarboxylating)
VDLPGLLTDDMGDGMLAYQRPCARSAAETAGWARTPVRVDPSAATRWPQMAALRQARAASGIITLETVVGQVKPTVLIGTSTAHGAFTQQVVETVSAGVERPVIFPISNPTSRIEAMPADIVAWSRGKALVATGLPIPPVDCAGVRYLFALTRPGTADVPSSA